MSRFTVEFDQSVREAEAEAEKVLRGAALSMFSSIIKRTPVDSGRLRNNWQAEINSIPTGEKESSNPSGDVANKTKEAKIKDSIYLVNNLPYAEVIENGSSKSAPKGMVKITVAEFDRKLNQEANKIR